MRFLSSYLDFIFEAVAKKEMRLYYSDEFRTMLRRINNSISQALLGAEDSNQVTDVYTLIDITDKNDTISLIQVNRIVRDNPDLGETLPYNIRLSKGGSDFWTKARTEMKIGRWVKRIFTEVHKSQINDTDIEKFVNSYKSTFDGGDLSNFEIVKGDDIKKWYHEARYEISRGQLGNSCMRYGSCQDYFDIYTKNPEVCSLLILKSTDKPEKIVGRSLLWELKDGRKYQDRIYTIKDSDMLLFEAWGRKNNYLLFNGGNYGLKVQLGNHEYSKYPYMDTFCAYNPKTKILADDEELWPTEGYYLLQDTNGGYRSDDVVWSDWCDEYIPRDTAVRCVNVNDWLPKDEAKYLKYKDIWVAPDSDDVVWSEYHEEYYMMDDCVYSELMSDWLFTNNENVIEVNISSDGDTDWCVKSKTELYIKVGDDYYSRKDCVKDPYTNEYKFKDRDYEKSLDEKLMKEFGIEINDTTLDRRGNPVTKVIDDVRADLKERLLNVELTDDIKNIIEEDKVYKESIRGVYWGLNKEDNPTSEDMFDIIKSFMIAKSTSGYNTTTFYYILMEGYKEYSHRRPMTKSPEKRFQLFYSAGMMRLMIKFCQSFDYSLFPEEIYKRYLFITI